MSPNDAAPSEPAPHSSLDDLVEVHERDVDRDLLPEALWTTPAERIAALTELVRFNEELETLREERG